MPGMPPGLPLLASLFLLMALAGIAALWAAWPRTSDTSPLAALFAGLWSGSYLATAVLTWRRSRFAPAVFVVAAGLLVLPLSFAFPGVGMGLPSIVGVGLVGFAGYRYLRHAVRIA